VFEARHFSRAFIVFVDAMQANETGLPANAVQANAAAPTHITGMLILKVFQIFSKKFCNALFVQLCLHSKS